MNDMVWKLLEVHYKHLFTKEDVETLRAASRGVNVHPDQKVSVENGEEGDILITAQMSEVEFLNAKDIPAELLDKLKSLIG